MNIYFRFYCRAYQWYNTTGTKPKDTLRGSALLLLSFIPSLYILIFAGLYSVIVKHTPVGPIPGVIIFALTAVFNFLFISSKKSDELLISYNELSESQRNRITLVFFIFLSVSLFSLLVIGGYLTYVKAKYGNYDIHL